MRALGLKREDLKNANVQKGRGCNNCNGSATAAVGIFEILWWMTRLGNSFMTGCSTNVPAPRAREMGMRTLRDDGNRKVLAGLTTPEDMSSAPPWEMKREEFRLEPSEMSVGQ